MALEHGGRVRVAAKRYGIPEKDWLDISTGINPDAWPVPALPADLWQRLPEDEDGLLEAAANFYGTSHLLPVAGSQAAIQTLPRLRKPCRVALAAPAYAEHERAWQQHGHRIIHDEELLQSDADVVVIVNPNNPTGRLYGAAELLVLHARLVRRGGLLVVDEAFMDATPEYSLARCCPQEGLIVLRSLGKFFGLAGARAGFVLAPETTLQPLAELLGPWPIATPARHVAALALCDTAWQEKTRATLQAASLRLSDMLIKHGFTPAGGNCLFQWVRCDDAASVHQTLAEQGILTRLFDTPASLRFGLPYSEGERSEGAWARLDAALMNCRSGFNPTCRKGASRSKDHS